MRQFKRHPSDWDKLMPDIVIEPNGQVWVTITAPAWTTWNAYEKIEDLRAKDYRRPGSTRGRARKGSGARGGRPSNGYTGGGYHFDEGHEHTRDGDPVDVLSEQIRLQASLYMRTYRPNVM